MFFPGLCRGRDGQVTDKRTYKTFYGVLRKMTRWLIEHGGFERVLVCNARHMENVPGRKTDLADAEWLAQLLWWA